MGGGTSHKLAGVSPRAVTSESRSVVPHSLRPWSSPGQNTGVGSLSLLQGIFPNQGSNPGLPHCRWILYQLSHKGSPRILEWVASPSSSAFSWPRNGTRVSCITGRFFTNWAINTDIIMMGKTEKLGFPKDCLKQHLDGVLTLLLHTEC